MCRVQCSHGIHRSLGVFISQVRSITLDRWRPDMLTVLRETDNAAVNRKYESLVPAAEVKPTEKITRTEKEDWIQRKYVDLAFMPADQRLRELEKRADEMKRVEEERRMFAEQMAERARVEEVWRQAEHAQSTRDSEQAANQNAGIGSLPRQPSDQQGEGEKIMDLFKKLWTDMTDATPESPPFSPTRRTSNPIASSLPSNPNTAPQPSLPPQQQNAPNPATRTESNARQPQRRPSRSSFSSGGKANPPKSPQKEITQPIENEDRPAILVAGTVREKPLDRDDWLTQAVADTEPVNVALDGMGRVVKSPKDDTECVETEGRGDIHGTRSGQ